MTLALKTGVRTQKVRTQGSILMPHDYWRWEDKRVACSIFGKWGLEGASSSSVRWNSETIPVAFRILP